SSFGGPWTDTPSTKAAVWEEGLRSEIQSLNHVGVPVVVVHPVPVVPASPYGCATLLVLTDNCSSAESRVQADRRLRRTLSAEQRAVRGLDATVLNLEGELCSAHVCASTRGNVITYRDTQHLSIPGALTLTPRFRRVIAAAATRRADATRVEGSRVSGGGRIRTSVG